MGGQNLPRLKTRFIVNPRSGCAVRALSFVRTFAAQRGADVMLTERARHASDLARRALDDGSELIVAVGGDGTMNEVAGQLVGTGATLGLVPCGSGDGLGRHLRIHGTITRALGILESGARRLIDTGLADGHPFFVVAGLGFEAEIAQRFNQLQRRGFLRYLTTSSRLLREWKPQEYTIAHADRSEHVRAFTLAVANTDQYGNDAFIGPGARIDDGMLDLCAIPPVTFWNGLSLATRLFRGTLSHASGYVTRRAERFVVTRASPGLLHTDGELHQAGATVEFRVRPASLAVMAPALSDCSGGL
jgi:diacylglycerol kinase (ATP)